MERDRDKILERRALFVASALSSVGCGAPQTQPERSASPPRSAPDASALVVAETPDAGVDASDAAAHFDAVAKVVVRVCLSLIIPPTVKFAFGSATPDKQSLTTLDEAILVLNDYPEVCVELEGHTDAREPGARKLSERRARAVERYFRDHGVAAERVWTVGYGSTRPISKPGDANNRRVEFRAHRGDECKRDGG